MTSEDTLLRTAAALRRIFDDAFAKPAAAPSSDAAEHLLKLRAGDQLIAMRLQEVHGVLRCPPVTTIPGGHSALLGIGSVRGRLVALYRLAELLDASSTQRDGEWIVLCGPQRQLALVVNEVQGHAKVSAEELTKVEPARAGVSAGLVLVEGRHRTLLRVSAIVAALSPPRRNDVDKE